LKENLFEEKFFFLYQLQQPPQVSMEIPIYERKRYIERYLLQKEKENEAMEAAKRKASGGK
jgi:hypothetical protein